ncbi:radical SAM family heme chaperone HemW [Hymenobacter busanensis]|uniref:Heme chaperone HemW n=1 Tax=Hymenobacter busanensis TaxID=2607656 RepID=A0A7L4ZZD3_9BACT|nr:radical SAM family heme chaperone HemW [Hymenobacter busanensis]KAA9333023.1 radical SAM family heme chaperone HemW [Hymenobacter busanensis]QHJ08303.1 radical SAM family heme chaperone HemW [Hymenobacter busanensis]
MAGLYLHIPFCKQACHYCDFHFSTALGRKGQVVEALVREMSLRRDYLGGAELSTIYFGGGTPSLLTAAELTTLFEAIYRYFPVAAGAEITLEANPDDLTRAKLHELAASPVNRLSIGLQSFHEPHLRLMNRAHSADESRRSVLTAQDAGFANISIDLIYGVPTADGDHGIWQHDLREAVALQAPHLSCYALTVEPQTVFGRQERKGLFRAAPDEFVARQFEMLLETSAAHGYEQYEISNFARPGHHSRHNSSYWQGVPYLGLGPSAHSSDGQSRQYTVASNTQYVQAVLERHELPATHEALSPTDRANEYLMTSLRTSAGCNLAYLRQHLGIDLAARHPAYLAQLQHDGWATLTGDVLRLTDRGKLLADQITLELFLEAPASVPSAGSAS